MHKLSVLIWHQATVEDNSSVYALYFLLLQVTDYTQIDKSIEISLSSYTLHCCITFMFIIKG